jgi:hypothetical protein
MRNFNQETIIEQESTAVKDMLHFLVDGPQKNVRILQLLDVPASVFSYYTKWSDFIVEHASIRYGIRFSVSDITVQHLVEYFAHRGGKGNLGKKRKKCSDETCAKISKAKKGVKGKKHSANHRAKISKEMKGKQNAKKA